MSLYNEEFPEVEVAYKVTIYHEGIIPMTNKDYIAFQQGDLLLDITDLIDDAAENFTYNNAEVELERI